MSEERVCKLGCSGNLLRTKMHISYQVVSFALIFNKQNLKLMSLGKISRTSRVGRGADSNGCIVFCAITDGMEEIL